MSVNPHYGVQGYGVGGYGNEPIESLPMGYYLNLLTSQYRNSPNLQKFIYTLLHKLDDVTQLLVKMDTSLDLDSATGAQLDMLGNVAGAQRTVNFQPSSGVSPTLDDDTFRLLIKAKISQNHWNGEISTIYAIWQNMFPDGSIVIIDNQNMTATITLKGTFTSIVQDLITHGYIIPRPEGVLYNYVFGVLPFFGFGYSPGYIAGFDEGHWV